VCELAASDSNKPSVMNAHSRFASTLAIARDQPMATFDALAALTDHLIGVKLFTLMTFDQTTRQAQRIYSNHPQAYPVLGTKEIETNRWTTTVLEQHSTFVANTIDDIASVFGDFELIQSLGCESVVNVPIVVGGRTLGTLNCLHEAGHYTEARVRASDSLKLPGAACFLLHACGQWNGDA